MHMLCNYEWVTNEKWIERKKAKVSDFFEKVFFSLLRSIFLEKKAAESKALDPNAGGIVQIVLISKKSFFLHHFDEKRKKSFLLRSDVN
jgi:hypothetical protein